MLFTALIAGMLLDYRGAHSFLLTVSFCCFGNKDFTAADPLMAGCMDKTGNYLLHRALAAAEQNTDRGQISVAKLWSARYYFFERWSITLQKCLSYTSASQTSTAVVAALGSFVEDHYWMYIRMIMFPDQQLFPPLLPRSPYKLDALSYAWRC